MRNDDWMSGVNTSGFFSGNSAVGPWYTGAPVTANPERQATDLTPKPIVVNKRTHRIRFENETESSVTVVIEPKESNVTE